MRRIILPKIKGLYLTIILKDDLLTLKMEEESSERTFSITLDNNSISQKTYGLFQEKEGFAKGLEDASNHPDSGLILNLSLGRLIYTVQFPEGISEESFTIDLVEQIAESDGVRKSKERLEILEEEMGELKERMAQMAETMEKSYNILQSWYSSDFYFDRSSIYDQNYVFSNENKTATLQAPFSPWIDPLELSPRIPQSGQHSYSLIINSMQSGIHFGIASEKKRSGSNQQSLEYKYWTGNGEIRGKKMVKAYGNGPFGEVGCIVKMSIDMDKGTLTFFVNEKKINTCGVSNTERYFAYIYLKNTGDCVTLVYF